MAEVKDPTLMNIILILGGFVTFIFTVLVFAFSGDIALYTMAVKADIFWESEYGYTNWAENQANSSITLIYSTYHTQAELLETDSIDAIMNAVTAVKLAGTLLTLILVALAFFRKPGGLIFMFKGASS